MFELICRRVIMRESFPYDFCGHIFVDVVEKFVTLCILSSRSTGRLNIQPIR